VIVILGNGFILTAMLWGAAAAQVIDRQLPRAALFFGLCAIFSLFGVIHSARSDGGLYLPWETGLRLPWELGLAYGVVAGLMVLLHLWNRRAGTTEG
jgi:AGZA family xanthine/uracil permease-like MFS transporter